MSIRIMQTVWELSKAKDTALLVMLAIADNANDQGVAWPSVETIAKKARCSIRTVQRTFNDLSDRLKELRIEKNGARAGCNRYIILLGHPRQDVTPPDNMSPRQVDGGDIAVSPGGVTQLCHQGGDIAVSPEPSLNRQWNRQRESPSRKLSPRHTSVQEMVVDNASMDFEGARKLLAHLNVQSGVDYPETPAALQTIAIALHAVGGDLEGALRTVTFQAGQLRGDVEKRRWLRPGTLFDCERFRILHAESARFAGTATPLSRAQLEAALKVEKAEEKRRQLLEQLNYDYEKAD